ncbi:proline-rich protein 2-like [Cinclus cinclus]|uniref:proline-rich protein 2-like n=1 Tax=Cinclus cinclus TaxID=127875 RepID=UPI002E15130E
MAEPGITLDTAAPSQGNIPWSRTSPEQDITRSLHKPAGHGEEAKPRAGTRRHRDLGGDLSPAGRARGGGLHTEQPRGTRDEGGTSPEGRGCGTPKSRGMAEGQTWVPQHIQGIPTAGGAPRKTPGHPQGRIPPQHSREHPGSSTEGPVPVPPSPPIAHRPRPPPAPPPPHARPEPLPARGAASRGGLEAAPGRAPGGDGTPVWGCEGPARHPCGGTRAHMWVRGMGAQLQVGREDCPLPPPPRAEFPRKLRGTSEAAASPNR